MVSKRRKSRLQVSIQHELIRHFVAGAMSVILHAKRWGTNQPWLANMIARKPTKVAAVAVANKNARIVWALLRHGGTYQKPVAVPVA